MGEVYRATDTNLKRAVAIKVLPASVALDVERLARFQREAEILAALDDVAGGVVQTIAKTSPASAAGGTWNEQNTILFSRGGSDGILRVAAGGGDLQGSRQPTPLPAWPAFSRHFFLAGVTFST